MNYKTKRTLKQILAVTLAGLAAFGAIFGLVKLSESLKEETKVISPAFSVGGLTANGEYEETDGSIYTKESFECQGLTVQLDFDSNVSYQAFYYDNLDKYISSSPVYEESMDLEVPKSAFYARLEVTPLWADDVNEKDRKVHWYNVASYANQLKISVNKEQESLNVQGSNKFTSYHELVGVSLSNGVSGFKYNNEGAGTQNATNLISTSGCKNISIKVSENLLDDIYLCMLTETSYIKNVLLCNHDYEEETFDGEMYITLSVPEDCEGICMFANSDIDFSSFEIYVW